MDPKNILLAGMVAIGLVYFFFWFTTLTRQRAAQNDHSTLVPTPLGLGIGFITNFFDTLGIGSYATSTSMFRIWKVVPDEKIPGTLNVGHTLPTLVQALIYITIVEVDFTTLAAIIGAAAVGAWLGGGVVAGLPRRQVQIGMGFALLGAATLMLLSLTGIGPAPGVALGVSGAKLGLAVGISMFLGALMMLGIGYYAPCLIMISLLGMNPTAAFPIMMGACAFLMPVGSLQFIRKQSYDMRTAIGLMVGGPGAVLIAALIVKSLPLDYVRWGVIIVVIYTAIGMLRTAAHERALGRRRATAEGSRTMGEFDFTKATDDQLIQTLSLLIGAYAANDTKLIEKLEPSAREIGEHLDRRGGIAEMRRLFARLPKVMGLRTLEMHWGGIGEWRG